jgi:hypothetical protein
MKLLIESCQEVTHHILEEDVNGTKKRNYYLEGIMMQSNRVNRNGRVYPHSVMAEGLSAFQDKIAAKGAVGELGHPGSPTINQDRVSHLITEMNWDGDNVIGRAKVIDTPNGRIVKTFIDEGIQIGMSSRATGAVRPVKGVQEVYKDFKLATVDIVADPSAHEAFVQGLMEGAEWVMENGVWSPKEAEEARDTILATKKSELDRTITEAFTKFLTNINRMV